jgi:tetratricopeptide (TPR) repeat protein
VDAKERWQALQTRLAAARGFINNHDTARALDEINAALAIDPDFLAAQSLRDRILTPVHNSETAQRSVESSPAAIDAVPTDAPRSNDRQAPTETAGYAKFEQRARRRRVDRRLDVARAAIDRRRLKEAAAALDEVIDLDPNQPELEELTAAFDNLRRAAAQTSRGPQYAAAVVFVAIVLGASWIEEQTGLQARPMLAVSGLIATPAPLPIPSPLLAMADAAALEPVITPEREPAPPAPARTTSAATVPVPVPGPVAAPAPSVVAPQPAAPAAASPSPAVATTAVDALPAMDTPVVASRPPVDDEALVQQALQRYRVAYDGLDAQSAHAVWPAVNQAALARAFDGLESQTLTFDACDVQLQTNTLATATCRGSARYVPKVGSRDPRTEPRVWSFSLRKAGNDWKIDNARVER